MALWMEPGSEPKTDRERADIDAIAALKESTASELKEQGNQYVKMGKMHYPDAIECYTRALNQQVLSESEGSFVFSNRAHVNLLLGNYRHALVDAQEAIKLHPTNLKAFYRAAKAALSLNLLAEAQSYCGRGLEMQSDNKELKKLASLIEAKKSKCEQREAQVSQAVAVARGLVSAIGDRGLRIGEAAFQELIGLRKPVLDNNKILHWPVLLLYLEVMSADFIEDFCETDMFSAHLDMMFSDGSPPLSWDKEGNYTRDAVELYYKAGSGVLLSETRLLRHLLEGTAGSRAENLGDEEADGNEGSDHSIPAGEGPIWIKVDEKRSLDQVLKDPELIIPVIPAFYAVSKRSNFYGDFRSGKWSFPA